MELLKLILAILLSIVTGALSGQQKNCKIVLKVDCKENAYPRVSKSGWEILYQSNVNGKWQLFVTTLAGATPTALTDTHSNNNFPDWSPDNQWIAFVSDRDGNEEIYLSKTNGSNAKRLTHDKARDIHPYFSPDGKYLLFNSTRGNQSFDIYRYTIATGVIERLTDTPDNETCARYSPDMTHIVYLKNDEESDDIYLMKATGSSAVNLTNTPPVQDGWPMFGPDGKWIY